MTTNKALSRRAFLLGAVAVVGAVVLPAPVKTASGATLVGGVLGPGVTLGRQPLCCPPNINPWWRLQYILNEFGQKANMWLQTWVKNTIEDETYKIFKSWFGTEVAT